MWYNLGMDEDEFPMFVQAPVNGQEVTIQIGAELGYAYILNGKITLAVLEDSGDCWGAEE